MANRRAVVEKALRAMREAISAVSGPGIGGGELELLLESSSTVALTSLDHVCPHTIRFVKTEASKLGTRRLRKEGSVLGRQAGRTVG